MAAQVEQLIRPASLPDLRPTDRALEIVLALDGRLPAADALTFARALAAERGATVRVVSVVEARGSEPLDDVRRATRATTIDSILVRAEADGFGWETRIETGCPVTQLARVTNEIEPDLLVLGHRPLDVRAALRDDTTFRLIRRVHCPVLAVGGPQPFLPRVAVSAVDFSASSLHAARAALPLLADDATLYLTHVQPVFGPGALDEDSLRSIYAQGVAAAFNRLAAELGAPRSVRVIPLLLEGHAGTEIAAAADRVNAALITLGTHRLDRSDYLRLGRLTTGFLRRSSRTLLVAPPPEGAGCKVQ